MKSSGSCGSRRTLLTLLLSLSVFSLRATAQAGEPSSALINRSGIVFNKVASKIYVVDCMHGAISIVDATGTAKSIKVGSGPEAIAVNSRTGRVYVANSGDRSVSVIDGTKDAVVATVASAARPYAIAVDELANKVYVSNTFSSMLTVIDGRTNIASNLKTGSTDAIVMDANRKRVYLLGYESDALTVLNSETHAITKMDTGAMHLWGIAEIGKTLYVTHVQNATIAAIDTETNVPIEIATGAMPCALAVNADTGEVYTANYGDGSVTVIDGVRGCCYRHDSGEWASASDCRGRREEAGLRGRRTGEYGERDRHPNTPSCEDSEGRRTSLRDCRKYQYTHGVCGKLERDTFHPA